MKKGEYIKMISLEKLNEWNKEHDRDDMLYYVELTHYRRGVNINWIEEPHDKVVMQTNDIDAAVRFIDYLKGVGKNYRIRLMYAAGIWDNNLEYESMDEHTYSDIGMEEDR